VAFGLIFLLGLGAIVAWWLSKQRLASKPWLEEGLLADGAGLAASPPGTTEKLGLGVFLAVVGSLFALFLSAYSMRAGLGDWRPIPVPGLLWVNTLALVFSSVALQYACVSARRGAREVVRGGLLAGGISATAFIAGQLAAWRQLSDAGYFLAGNPANTFFYLLTAVHGLHLAGGVIALGRAAVRARGGRAGTEDLRLSVTLCAIYWHFLLLVWLLLFGLLLVQENETLADFVLRCKSLILGLS
jgi:cytochrome c oxidase subunit III